MTFDPRPFWQRKTLAELSPPEWEALCDGCGQCCRHKLEDGDTGEVYLTKVGCQLLNTQTCRCTDYANRQQTVPECIELTSEAIKRYHWLPKTCAYRRLAEGNDLDWWHPLVSGDPNTVHSTGISVQGQLVNELNLAADAELEDYLEESSWT